MVEYSAVLYSMYYTQDYMAVGVNLNECEMYSNNKPVTANTFVNFLLCIKPNTSRFDLYQHDFMNCAAAT